MEIKVRKASRTDIPEIRELVIELAIYEKEPDAVSATLDDYYEAYDTGLISMLVAEQQDKIIGMTLYYDTFSTWKGKMLYLEDFVVKETYRSNGIGELLFSATIQAARDRGCVMMKWQVLDWNSKAVAFYKRHGATIEKEWWNGKLLF